MNGGTNIAAAIQKSGQLFKRHADDDSLRIVVLVTDGRVDTYQVCVAHLVSAVVPQSLL